ncbi:MAG TPA: FkbM family methyltransferase [Candidatus Acidoferrum sp.]|jgi:FkbM family methyltransferase|nr:FkbM family methyltransferase [Candidatus Acidoferrum sp.]
MKLGRILVIVCAVTILSVAVGVRVNPSSLILLSRDVKIRSSYCSVWKASLDNRIKLRQQASTKEIAQRSHIIRREVGLALWSTPSGEYWIPDVKDDIILPLLLAQTARNIYGTGDWGVQPGDVVLDVGAYVGTWTRDALARGAKLVVAIEPTAASVECLRRNLAAEIAAGKVIVYPKGIWDSEGALTFFANGDGVGNSFVEHAAGFKAIDSIPVTTIDQVAAELHLARVDFIKGDVKGATERLLRGGSAVIKRDHPRLAFSTEEPVDDAPSIARLALQIQPAYRTQCGPCLLDGKEIYTDVMSFR